MMKTPISIKNFYSYLRIYDQFFNKIFERSVASYISLYKFKTTPQEEDVKLGNKNFITFISSHRFCKLFEIMLTLKREQIVGSKKKTSLRSLNDDYLVLDEKNCFHRQKRFYEENN